MNGISHSYQLDQSNFVLRIVALLGGIFLFIQFFNRNFCKQTVETYQSPRSVASCLGLHCFTKRTLDLYGLMLTQYCDLKSILTSAMP